MNFPFDEFTIWWICIHEFTGYPVRQIIRWQKNLWTQKRELNLVDMEIVDYININKKDIQSGTVCPVDNLLCNMP